LAFSPVISGFRREWSDRCDGA